MTGEEDSCANNFDEKVGDGGEMKTDMTFSEKNTSPAVLHGNYLRGYSSAVNINTLKSLSPELYCGSLNMHNRCLKKGKL